MTVIEAIDRLLDSDDPDDYLERHIATWFGCIRKHQQTLQTLVDQQALDDGLWFRATTAPEAYLQSQLRKLHNLIESDI